MRNLILLGMGLLFCACTLKTPQSEVSEPEPTERAAVPFAAGEIADTFAWIGKTASEIGAGQQNTEYGSIAFTCDLFGHTVNGTAFLETAWDEPGYPSRVYRIWLTDDIANMANTEAALSERYGEPYGTFEEPYVESNGGVTFYRYTWTGVGNVLVKNGQKNTFYELSYSVPDEVPAEIRKRLAGLTTEELGPRTGVYFRFEDGDVEHLHIDETEYEGFAAYYITFTREGIPYRIMLVKNGSSMFDALTGGEQWTERDIEGAVTSRSMLREDGTGLVYEKNVFGDLWVIETDEPTDADALSAFELFLLQHWLF